MDKIEQLWVRACKSNQPHRRVLTLHKRFYGAYEDNLRANQNTVTALLSQIVDKYVPFKTSQEIIDEVTKPIWQFDERDAKERAFHMIVNRIRLSRKDAFVGLTPPLRFRNKGE